MKRDFVERGKSGALWGEIPTGAASNVRRCQTSDTDFWPALSLWLPSQTATFTHVSSPGQNWASSSSSVLRDLRKITFQRPLRGTPFPETSCRSWVVRVPGPAALRSSTGELRPCSFQSALNCQMLTRELLSPMYRWPMRGSGGFFGSRGNIKAAASLNESSPSMVASLVGSTHSRRNATSLPLWIALMVTAFTDPPPYGGGGSWSLRGIRTGGILLHTLAPGSRGIAFPTWRTMI